MDSTSNILQNDDSFGLNEATPVVAPTEVDETSAIEEQDDSMEHENAISSTTSETSNILIEKQSDVNSEPDSDFFAGELSISNVPAEKINENVEDIVQDLENLLGESDFNEETFESSKLSQSHEFSEKSNVCEAESTNIGELPSSSLEGDFSLVDNETPIQAINDEHEMIEDVPVMLETIESSEPTSVAFQSESEVVPAIELIEEQTQEETEAAVTATVESVVEEIHEETEAVVASAVESIEKQSCEEFDVVVAPTIDSNEEQISEDKLPIAETLGGSESVDTINEGEGIEKEPVIVAEITTFDEVPNSVTVLESETEAVQNMETTTDENEISRQELPATDIIESNEVLNASSECETEIVPDVANENVSNNEMQDVTETVSIDSNCVTDMVDAESVSSVNNDNKVDLVEAMDVESTQVIGDSIELLEENIVASSMQDVETELEVSEPQQVVDNEAIACNISEEVEDSNLEIQVNPEEQSKDDVSLGADIKLKEDDTEKREMDVEEQEDMQVDPLPSTEVSSVVDAPHTEIVAEDVMEENESEKVIDSTVDTNNDSNSNLETCDAECVIEEEIGDKLNSNSEVSSVTVETYNASQSIIGEDFNIKPDSVEDVSTTEDVVEEYSNKLEIETSNDEIEVNSQVVEQSGAVEISSNDQDIQNSEETSTTSIPILNEDEKEVTRSTELDQPLTVEVEDPNFLEQQLETIAEVCRKEKYMIQKDEAVEIAQVADQTTSHHFVKSGEENQKNRAPLKMTITKNKSENMHSILKIYDPNEAESSHEPQIPKLIIKSTASSSELSVLEEPSIPKITIKPVLTPSESQHSPRLTIKPLKPPSSSESSDKQYSPKITVKSISPSTGSPKITIKPLVKPESLSPLKLTIRSIPNSEELQCSPKLTIKPIVKPDESASVEAHHSPKITIKPIIKPPDEGQSYTEERCSPRITIKPIIKPPEENRKVDGESSHGSRLTIKPIMKPSEEQQQQQNNDQAAVSFKLNIKPVLRSSDSNSSPKITIKPVTKPEAGSESSEFTDFEDQIKQERIVLKIPRNAKKEKGTPTENEKLKKIKLKFSKDGGLAHIVPMPRDNRSTSLKRSSENVDYGEMKHFKVGPTIDLTSDTHEEYRLPPGLTITRVDHVEQSSGHQFSVDDSNSSDDVRIVSVSRTSDKNLPPNIKTSKSVTIEVVDPLADIPVFEITPENTTTMSHAATINAVPSITTIAPTPPRKRGRPRKVPLEVREEFKDPKEEEIVIPTVVVESSRPKRSCRGPSVRQALGIKPRKPRGGGRGRGGSHQRTVSTRATTAKKAKLERKTSPATKLRGVKDHMVKETEFKEFEVKDVEFKQVPLPTGTTARSEEVVIYEEETRMSADNSSRAQTPAKQVLATSTEVIIEESQSSVQSSTTTESSEKVQKNRKGPRLEVHQEPEGEVISADKLAEYSWGGGGPYMLQEQVAQFLGIKSFKRKYPGIQRRPVEMQERDFIRETGLASEAMCDMGLTAVKSEDILDIMYTDFQHKYEEYCKHQRDRQAKDVSNKQKALSLAASQEKNKLDIVEQAVQSTFQWNANFNKTRREQRRACMDLQTFTVHFPKGRMKQVNKPLVGNYPLSLVPGQFTDYYKKYNSFELNNLPLNTIGCKGIGSSANQDTEESQSDGSASDSDSSSSDSDSSYSGSSGAEDCKMCSPIVTASKKILVR